MNKKETEEYQRVLELGNRLQKENEINKKKINDLLSFLRVYKAKILVQEEESLIEIIECYLK